MVAGVVLPLLALLLAQQAPPASGEAIVGIDLGTTYSCVTIVRNGEVEVVPNDLGERTTPSWVAYSDTGRLVGQAAKNQVDMNPENTIYDSKRLIGQDFKSIKKDLKFYSFTVLNKGGKPFVQVMFKGKKVRFAPEEVSAVVLAKMKLTAENYLGEPVSKAVITVPAYFNDAQRTATKAAGEIAGLEVSRIVNEPTAAAMAYGIDKLDGTQNIIVYDLGGGTFDVSVLTVDHGVFEVLATNGDTHLGGEDLDKSLMGYCLRQFKKKTGHKVPDSDARARQRLRQAVNDAKHILSSKLSAKVEVDSFFKGEDLSVSLTRARLEDITGPLLRKTMGPVKSVLEDAGLSNDEIDQVVLVGGSTRIPFVRKMLGGYFGKDKVNTEVNPDEAVAVGAGMQASILAGEQLVVPGTGGTKGEMVLLDVTPLSMGIEVVNGIFSPIISRNTAVPTRKSKTYTTVQDNQNSISIEVFQGDSDMAKRNHKLGQFVLDKIPPAPRGVPQVEVEFFIDANGILQVSAEDKGTKRKKSIQIKHSKGRFTDEQIEKMKARAKKWESHDKAEKARLEALMALEKLAYDVEKQVDGGLGEKMSSDERAELKEAVKEVQNWIEYNQKAKEDVIAEQKEALEDIWNPIVRRHYGGRGGSGGSGGGGDTDAEEDEWGDDDFDDDDEHEL